MSRPPAAVVSRDLPTPATSASATAATTAPPVRSRRTLAVALLGSVLTYLAFPPVAASLLVWVGLVPWMMLIRTPRFAGRRPYLTLWLAGAAFWVLTVQWIRLPYWANIFALFLLAAYLGAYLPVFVGLSRVAVHRLRAPLWLAAPVVWTGLEWLRARLLTGFMMASLAHTQVRFPKVIQIADLVGEYGVTFLIVLVAAAIAGALPASWVERALGLRSEDASAPRRPRVGRNALASLLPAAVVLAATLAYAHFRLRDLERAADSRPQSAAPRLALIQPDMLALWKNQPDRDDNVMREQMQLSLDAVRKADPPVDLVIWPETMYRDPLWTVDPHDPPPLDGLDHEVLDATPHDLTAKTKELGAALMTGIDRYNLLGVRAGQGIVADDGVTLPYRVEPFNSSALVDRTGKLLGTYDKMHLLPFGEFIPFVNWLPFLRDYSPITGAARPGRTSTGILLDGVVYSPNICYESVLPQLIRRQVAELAAVGRTPDVLVNLTNDAWYWGSSELDMHLASGVFRAVEMRTPLVIAANRGLSASIDFTGRVVAESERDQSAYVITDVRLPPRTGAYPSLYARYGDWFPLACLGCCAALAIVGWQKNISPRRHDEHNERNKST